MLLPIIILFTFLQGLCHKLGNCVIWVISVTNDRNSKQTGLVQKISKVVKKDQEWTWLNM